MTQEVMMHNIEWKVVLKSDLQFVFEFPQCAWGMCHASATWPRARHPFILSSEVVGVAGSAQGEP